MIFNGLLVAAWLTRGTGIVTKGQPKLVAVMPDAVTGKGVKGNIYGIVRARLARATMGNIRQNLFFALIYNATGVLIAAGILYPFLGILIGPIFAAFAISVSPLSVVLNALRLRTAMV